MHGTKRDRRLWPHLCDAIPNQSESLTGWVDGTLHPSLHRGGMQSHEIMAEISRDLEGCQIAIPVMMYSSGVFA